jgi:hypothetical protein
MTVQGTASYPCHAGKKWVAKCLCFLKIIMIFSPFCLSFLFESIFSSTYIHTQRTKKTK